MKITVKAKILFNCKVAINLKKSDLNETNNLVNVKDVAFGFLSQFWETVNVDYLEFNKFGKVLISKSTSWN